LEHISEKTFENNNIKFNQISVLDHEYKIYFWRRRRNPKNKKQWQMELWKYDANIEGIPELVELSDGPRIWKLTHERIKGDDSSESEHDIEQAVVLEKNKSLLDFGGSESKAINQKQYHLQFASYINNQKTKKLEETGEEEQMLNEK